MAGAQRWQSRYVCAHCMLLHYAENHECPGTLGFSTNTKVIKDFSTWADRSPISLALSVEFLSEQTVSLKNLFLTTASHTCLIIINANAITVFTFHQVTFVSLTKQLFLYLRKPEYHVSLPLIIV